MGKSPRPSHSPAGQVNEMDDSDSDDNLGTSPQEGFSAAPARRARGGAATSPGRNPASNLRRVTHSAVEKRRREKLRERLEVLRSVVPSCSTQANLHKINVLDSAIEYICYMRRCMQKLVVERDAAYSAATAAAAAANNSASAASAAATAHMNISNQGCRECAQRAASRFPTRSSHPVMIHQVPSPASTPVAPTTTWQQVGPAHHAYAAGSPPSVQPMRSPSLAQQSPGQYSHAEQEQQQHYHTHHHHQHSHTHSQVRSARAPSIHEQQQLHSRLAHSSGFASHDDQDRISAPRTFSHRRTASAASVLTGPPPQFDYPHIYSHSRTPPVSTSGSSTASPMRVNNLLC